MPRNPDQCHLSHWRYDLRVDRMGRAISRLALWLLLLSTGAAASVCDGQSESSSCLLSDGQTLGTCARGACTRTFTVPSGETHTGTGTIDVTTGGAITGTGTVLDTELHVGDLVQCVGGA